MSSYLELIEEIPHPLVLVLAGDPEKPRRRGGMTAAWVSRVSWDPPIIAVSIAPERYTYELIKEFKVFTINSVSKEFRDLAMNVFGVLSGKDVDKFEVAKVRPGKARKVLAPVIPSSPLILECEYVNEFVVGDHVVVLGRVVDVYRGSESLPLAYYRGTAVEIKLMD
ncbi:MAG: flavin reductase family protein [Desulfurococcaceae archaeon]|nr:flavin reductase family protein [Desulfurococcaceae archaeon]